MKALKSELARKVLSATCGTHTVARAVVDGKPFKACGMVLVIRKVGTGGTNG
jgi:hypothetical protein